MEKSRDELDAELFRDGLPLQKLDKLRRDSPVFETHFPDGTRAWNLVRYDDVFSVLTSWRNYSVQAGVVHAEPQADMDENREPWCLKAAMALNPPDHGLHKQKLAPTMKPDLIEAFRPVVRQIAEDMVQRVRQRGNIDAIEDFAAPVAAAVICKYLGIKQENRDYVRRLSADFMGDSLPPPTIGAYCHMNLGVRALNAVQGSPMRAATELVYESWGQAPWLDKDFVNHAGRWEVEELALQTLTAGIAGLRNCVATAVKCIAPQWSIAKRDEAIWIQRVPMVADEVIRHATPLLRVTRIVTADAMWHGTAIRAGETLLVWLVGANFDPTKFCDPNTFQPFRTPNPHLSFSWGTHHCLGAPLARMEVEEIVRAMLKAWTCLQLRASPVRFVSNIVNEFLELPIHVA